MVRAALDALAIAGKAGTVVAGFAKVEAALNRDKMLALMHGADAGRTGSRTRRRAAPAGRTRPYQTVTRLPRPNWIWHWGGQMWYMQPCWPDLQATLFWRVFIVLSGFGPENRPKAGRGREAS